ncbi:MAG: hypothetical protein V7739_03790 [Motiliproteus sp.]
MSRQPTNKSLPRLIQMLPLTLTLLVSPQASAHLLKLFVYAEGNLLQGSCYFAGGSAAKGVNIRILAATGDEIAKLQSDDQGEFSYQASTTRDYRLIADSGDGHRAEWTVKADEMTPPSDLQADLGNGTIVSTTSPPINPSQASSINNNELAILVERSVTRAVAKQVGPLRQELQRNADKARLADIVGGIGFMFGLAGILLWWRSRR